MQRTGRDFYQNRSAQIYSKADGVIKEVIELPNGQWQFGRGRDAVVVTNIEEVKEFGEDVQTAVAKWLEKVKGMSTQPQAVKEGPTPQLQGESVRDQLDQALRRMPDSALNRILHAITSTLGPEADSLAQGGPVNSHGDGFGQDQTFPAPAATGGFTLPEGAWWAEEGRPEAGYYTFNPGVTDAKGRPTKQWHQTPQSLDVIEAAPDKTDVELEMEREREKFHEEQLVGAGRRTSRRRA